nr:chlorophyll a/b-binding protein [Oscillatoria acuminata]
MKQPYFDQGSQWKWGFTPSAEIWNGRLAMIGFLAATLIEIATGQGYLRFLGFLTGTDIAP